MQLSISLAIKHSHDAGPATAELDKLDEIMKENAHLSSTYFTTSKNTATATTAVSEVSSEIKSHFQQAGFEILKYEEIRSELPAGFRNKITGRFRSMSIEELSVTGIKCVLKKP